MELGFELDDLMDLFEFGFLHVAMLFANHSSTLISVFRKFSRVILNLNILMISFAQVLADLKAILHNIYL